jgi:hypothetical protein
MMFGLVLTEISEDSIRRASAAAYERRYQPGL